MIYIGCWRHLLRFLLNQSPSPPKKNSTFPTRSFLRHKEPPTSLRYWAKMDPIHLKTLLKMVLFTRTLDIPLWEKGGIAVLGIAPVMTGFVSRIGILNSAWTWSSEKRWSSKRINLPGTVAFEGKAKLGSATGGFGTTEGITENTWFGHPHIKKSFKSTFGNMRRYWRNLSFQLRNGQWNARQRHARRRSNLSRYWWNSWDFGQNSWPFSGMNGYMMSFLGFRYITWRFYSENVQLEYEQFRSQLTYRALLQQEPKVSLIFPALHEKFLKQTSTIIATEYHQKEYLPIWTVDAMWLSVRETPWTVGMSWR